MIYIAYPSETPEEIKEVFSELTQTFEVTTPEDRSKLPKEEFPEKSRALLKESSIFIAEASSESSGLEIEVTSAHEEKIPILLFVKFGRDYPTPLKDFYLRLIKYSTAEDLKIKLNKFLSDEFPGESKKDYFKYSDKKQYQAYKKGWERKYK